MRQSCINWAQIFLTYEIQTEGGLTHIVHQNQLFLLLPKEEDDNCMPLVAALQVEIMGSLGWSPGYAPSEVDMIPEESMRMFWGMPAHRPGQTWWPLDCLTWKKGM